MPTSQPPPVGRVALKTANDKSAPKISNEKSAPKMSTEKSTPKAPTEKIVPLKPVLVTEKKIQPVRCNSTLGNNWVGYFISLSFFD